MAVNPPPASAFELIAPFITPGVINRVAKLLDLQDEETCALIVARMIAPDRFITKGQEAKLRGLRPETLKEYKDQGFYPEYVNAEGKRGAGK